MALGAERITHVYGIESKKYLSVPVSVCPSVRLSVLPFTLRVKENLAVCGPQSAVMV